MYCNVVSLSLSLLSWFHPETTMRNRLLTLPSSAQIAGFYDLCREGLGVDMILSPSWSAMKLLIATYYHEVIVLNHHLNLKETCRVKHLECVYYHWFPPPTPPVPFYQENIPSGGRALTQAQSYVNRDEDRKYITVLRATVRDFP